MNFNFPRGREPFNGWSHLFATLLAVFGTVALVETAWHQGAMLYAKIFYSVTLISAFGSSALYHLAVTTQEKLRILRNLDHICILALMIGTYVPLAIALFPEHWNILLLVSFLILLCAGIRLAGEKNRRVLSISYITLASLPAIAVPFLWEEHWRNILWFSLGSCFYSIGAFCYIKKFPKNHAYLKFHEIWHIFTLLGALVHYLVIYHLQSS
ncbi:MAG: hemolysin III family protein [Verrucomicrobiota bacterium]